jgi:hypothetical protein
LDHRIIEDCTVRWANSQGIDVGNEHWHRQRHMEDEPGSGRHIIRRNTITDCGICGIAAVGNNANTLVEDNVLVWARGLASPVVAPGASASVAFLPSLARARLSHKPLAWTTATLSRDADGAARVVAGVSCAMAHVSSEGRTIDVCVEQAAPHRIVQMTTSDGYAMTLTGTVRTAYWKKNHEGDEALLERGLPPRRLARVGSPVPESALVVERRELLPLSREPLQQPMTRNARRAGPSGAAGRLVTRAAARSRPAPRRWPRAPAPCSAS